MKHVYISGHGLMAEDKNKDGVLLKHTLHTYCKDSKMLEGGVGSTSILDKGVYSPKHESSKTDAQAQKFNADDLVSMHYAYGATSTMADFKDSTKLSEAKKAVGGLHGNKIQLDKGAGVLFKLNDDDYLYCTAPATLTSLSVIQDAIDVKLFQEEYELHWVACRSYIPAGTDEEVLAYVVDNGADGDGLKNILR